MLEKPWIKKGSDITEKELAETARKALAHATEANPSPKLHLLNTVSRKEIETRFPVTNDDELREDAALRSLVEGPQDIDAKKSLADEARKTEIAEVDQMEAMRDRLMDIYHEIMEEMEATRKMGILGSQDKETKEKIDSLENEYAAIEKKMKDLAATRSWQNPERN